MSKLGDDSVQKPLQKIILILSLVLVTRLLKRPRKLINSKTALFYFD